MLSFGILIVSDRSAAGQRQDATTSILASLITEQAWQIAKQRIVPDEIPEIEKVLLEWADQDRLDVILTSGGTGLSPRDVTPEATLGVIDRQIPGIAEALRVNSLKITPHAMLSRAVAGMRGASLIINLPGSPKGARENLEMLLPVLPHAVQLITSDPNAESGHGIK